ncbi:MAG: hypothetical protein HUU50_20230 [Candidatus Brocadiae bacterium]|nr:hypothetical protein [Candidatus Brocadiia bacterium]
MGKIIFILILFFNLCYGILGQSLPEKEDQKPKLGPNTKLFLAIQSLWMQKKHHDLLSLMDTRVRLNFNNLEQGSPQSYAAEQASGILKEHFLEIKILKFAFIPRKVQQDTGVAFYQYEILKNGIIKNKMLYIYLKQKTQEKSEEKIWVISGINQIECAAIVD